MADTLSRCSIKAHDPLIHTIYCQLVSPANDRTLAGPDHCSLSSALDQLSATLGAEEFLLGFLHVWLQVERKSLMERQKCVYFSSTAHRMSCVWRKLHSNCIQLIDIQKRRMKLISSAWSKCRREWHIRQNTADSLMEMRLNGKLFTSF